MAGQVGVILLGLVCLVNHLCPLGAMASDKDYEEEGAGTVVVERLNVTSKPMPTPGTRQWYYKGLEQCLQALGPNAYNPLGELGCNGTWDSILCWPATSAGATIQQQCPPLKGLDQSKFGYKKCGPDGRWEGKIPGDYSSPQGWTNYSGCYTDEAKKIYDRLFKSASSASMKEIATGARTMEMVGLCLSLLALSISLFIFFSFRSLKCHRTRIHRNLFFAILLHVVLRLVNHVDALIPKMGGGGIAGGQSGNVGTISNTPVLCEIFVTIVQYSKTVMFLWMFVEGMYLHNMLVVSVFSGKPNYVLYYCLCWGGAAVLTLNWATTNIFLDREKCWFGYTFRVYYWILEGPRLAIIAVNLIFLLNIIRVLVTKLRESHSTEAVQVRKAVKAAIVLLPLLGVNNFLEMVEGPTDGVVKFAIWLYISHFLSSFQGFFISLLYCFLNGEVQQTLRTQWERYQQQHGHYTSGRRRLSRTMSIFTSVTEVPNHQVNQVRTHTMAVVDGQRRFLRQENGETCI